MPNAAPRRAAPPAEALGFPPARRIGLLRTFAFRIVLLYVVVFAVSAAGLLAFSYWNVKASLDTETDSIVAIRLSGLNAEYQRGGAAGLVEAINLRARQSVQMVYLLAAPDGTPIAGNLEAWPQFDSVSAELVRFSFVKAHELRHARGVAITLIGGYRLLVARDISSQLESEALFTTTLPWSVGLLLLVALGGGLLLSRNLARRLEQINTTSREIMAGDLSRRVPLTGSAGEFDLLAGNLNTMLTRIEELLKGVREVSDSVAHDLRTPLNRLRNKLEGVYLKLDPDGATAADVEAAIAECDGLIATFNALLLIAEAEAGVVREAMTLVDLSGVVEGVAELYAPVAEEKSITLQVRVGEALRIEADRALLNQALANLLDNAIKYTPEGGTVTVAVEDRTTHAALSVADNGPGIAAEDRKRVTQRFVRLETSRNSPGTGLGLSLVAAVARLHDGRLCLSDNAPGLKAVLELPRAARRPLPRTV